MAKQLQKIENYVVFSDTATATNLGEYAINHCVYTEETDRFIIKEVIDNGSLTILKSEIAAGDWVDGGSIAYDERGVRDFLQANTGFKAAGGGSSAGSTLFGLDRTVTDFNFKTESPSSSANAVANKAYYYVFRLDGSCKVTNMGFKLNTLSSTVGAVFYGALYKYDIDTDSINLVGAMTSEINSDNASGFLGFNFANFASLLTLEPGIYLTRLICNQAVQFGFSNQVDNPIGVVGAGTSSSKYYGFTQFPAGGYDFGSTPTNIALSTLNKETSFTALPGKAFFTISK
jgi:hypothetical protein